jgi:hypothetical protein
MTTDANDTADTVVNHDTTPAKPKPTPRKKTPVKKEFAPKVTDTGRLDHTNCGHERTPKGRAACRVAAAKK